MNASPFKKPGIARRIGALVAALSTTAMLLGSQLVIADRYAAQILL